MPMLGTSKETCGIGSFGDSAFIRTENRCQDVFSFRMKHVNDKCRDI
jgi:hypothetical protein